VLHRIGGLFNPKSTLNARSFNLERHFRASEHGNGRFRAASIKFAEDAIAEEVGETRSAAAAAAAAAASFTQWRIITRAMTVIRRALFQGGLRPPRR